MIKNITINGDFLCRNLTGIERFAYETTIRLDKIIEKDSLSILVPKNAKFIPDFENIKVVRSNKSCKIFPLWEHIFFSLYLFKTKSIPLDFANVTPLFKPGIVFIHDIYAKLYPKDFTSKKEKLIRLYMCMMYKHCAKHAKKLLTVSNFSKKQISSTYHVKEDDISVIYNGWEHIKNIEADNSIFDEHPELTEKNYFFTLGSLQKRKNLKWICNYASKNHDERFAISGKAISGMVSNELKELQTLKNVVLLGYVSDAQVKALMQKCKAFVFPSYYEGFGIPPLEALACGAPIIIGNAASLPELYGNTAHYIDCNNTDVKLSELLKNQTEAPERLFKEYSYRQTAEKLKETLSEFTQMKIAIDCRMIGSGGIGSYISALLPHFLRDNKCLLIGSSEQLKKFSAEKNAEIVICNTKPFSLKEIFNFPKAILKKINRCDLYYSPYCNVPGGIKIPLYTTIHDVVFLDVPGLASKAGTFIRKCFYKRACFYSKEIFTVSNFSAQRIKHHLHCKKNIVCTYNALPDWFFENKKPDSSLAKEDKILFVGNIKKHKGLSTLLDAFIKAKEKGLSSSLVIVGNKDNFRTADEQIFNKINSAPQNSVTFTGKITDEDLKNLYKQSKVLVQPSLYEGFGMPPLEALNLGTHVILTDIPVFKEIYEDFPVTFYKAEDSEELYQKLLDIENIIKEPLNIPDKYSFEKTYSIIMNSLETK
ncbi:Glycosyltransferase [Treponema sp. JC4]|uniref:glycosyltransferase family 4 protein n=1 Tax=Treponema sp. JC4 TaxID=1124982 RepID=UPI00025AFDC5|nr:glycosyltransferase family 1 protein [Treponema sp. JC4]EID84089.1 Glycosyltransferase [Treponema sp. JC4]